MSRVPVWTCVVIAIQLGVGAWPMSAVAQESDRVPIAEFVPLTAEPDPSAEALELRAELLGDDHDNPDRVTLHWTGVSSFVVTLQGHLLLFDAWEIIGAHADYLPIGREELAGLEPEAILVGHGHFDHAADVGYVAGRTGAVVVGSEEICDTAKTDAAADGLAGAFVCAVTGTMTEPPPGTMQTLELFEDVQPISILQHVHSAATPPSENNELDPFVPVFDPLPYLTHLNSDPEAATVFLETLGDPQGGTWMYHFRVGSFSFLLGDSSGPIFDHPDVQQALDAFPDCVDVMANAILGFDQPVSGLQDPVLYVEHVHPQLFIPTHADAWAPVISAGQDQYEDEFRSEMQGLENPPELLWINDPEDYLRQISFDVDGDRWAQPMPGSACASDAAGPAPDGGGGFTVDEDSTPTTGGGHTVAALVAIFVALLVLRRQVRPATGS